MELDGIRKRLLARRDELAHRASTTGADLRREHEPLSPDFSEQAVQRENDDVLRSRLCLFGGVDTVVERMVALHAMGVRHVMALQNFGLMAPEVVHRSMRLMAEEVMPRVRARVAALAMA